MAENVEQLLEKLLLLPNDQMYKFSETEIEELCYWIFMLSRKLEKNRSSIFLDFTYYLILKYTLITNDYKFLYLFSVNYGLYPITNKIISESLILPNNINMQIIILNDKIRRDFTNSKNNITFFKKQKDIEETVKNNSWKNLLYVAPTSYGKSSFIIEDAIRRFENNQKKICIIVPTKALLNEFKVGARKISKTIKIITHDQMYLEEQDKNKKILAILTQERMLRIYNKNSTFFFDCLYIDEAHNIFKFDDRNILLSRAIKISRERNFNLQVIFLSPLIFSSNNLIFDSKERENFIEKKIDFNIKIPEIYYLSADQLLKKYERFLESFIVLKKEVNYFKYIIENVRNKNFFYISTPIKIERFCRKLFAELNERNFSIDNSTDFIYNLEKYIHKDFILIDFIKKGIVYNHAKLPDSLRDYILYKFTNDSQLHCIVSNTSILEGVNLPIDTLFILDCKFLTKKNQVNLIGRVNRLNDIFNQDKKTKFIEKLFPKIHFIDSEFKNKKINTEKIISSIYKDSQKDNLFNPLLLNTKESEKIKPKAVSAIEKEKIIFDKKNQNINLKILLEQNIDDFYERDYSVEILNLIAKRVENFNSSIDSNNVFDVINEIFLKDFSSYAKDNEFFRLAFQEARHYYYLFLNTLSKLNTKNFIAAQIKFWKKESEKDSFVYFGNASGYAEYGYNNSKFDIYKTKINLKEKTDKDLVNLAIIKLNLESNFLNFKVKRTVETLYRFQKITESEYNKIMFGTDEKIKLDLILNGLNSYIIRILEDNNQLKNISSLSNGTFSINKEFEIFLETQDDFIKFQLKNSLGISL